jgi:hypothetical protein
MFELPADTKHRARVKWLLSKWEVAPNSSKEDREGRVVAVGDGPTEEMGSISERGEEGGGERLSERGRDEPGKERYRQFQDWVITKYKKHRYKYDPCKPHLTWMCD